MKVGLSVVVPIFNELESLPELLSRLEQSCAKLGVSSEVLIVDDASSDGSRQLLEEWASSDSSESRVPDASGIPFRSFDQSRPSEQISSNAQIASSDSNSPAAQIGPSESSSPSDQIRSSAQIASSDSNSPAEQIGSSESSSASDRIRSSAQIASPESNNPSAQAGTSGRNIPADQNSASSSSTLSQQIGDTSALLSLESSKPPTSAAPVASSEKDGTIPLRRVLCLPRNLGQYGATRSGLAAASGKRVAVLDGDLQDPPEVLATLLEKAQAEPELKVVFAIKSKRGDPWFLRAAQRLFHGLQGLLSKSPYLPGAGSYCVMDGDLARAIGEIPIAQANLGSVLAVLTVPKGHVRYSKEARRHGSSRVGFLRLVHEALESMALTGALENLSVLAAVTLLGTWAALVLKGAFIIVAPGIVAAGFATALAGTAAVWFHGRRRRRRYASPLAALGEKVQPGPSAWNHPQT